jgi:hypothetical protein
MAFKDTEIHLEASDYKAFAKLAANSDFQHWREVVENFQLKRAFNFLAGTDLPKDIPDAQSYYRGGYDMYVKIMRIIDTAPEALHSITQTHGQDTSH